MNNNLINSDLILSTHFDAEYWKAEMERDPRLKSYHTQRGYLADLAHFEEWRAGRPATKLLVEEYAAKLQRDELSPTTINRKLAAIRWYARRVADLARDKPANNQEELFKQSAMTEQAERIASVANVTGKREEKGRHITPGELQALMQVCENDPTPAGARDAALLAVAWSCGLRRDELDRLTCEDWIPGIDEGDLIIHGKGDKTRSAYIFNGAYYALMDWLAIRGNEPGILFCEIQKSGKIIHTQITGESLRIVLKKREKQAGIKHLTWHDFRRSFAGNLLDNQIDLVTVQKLMGHSSPITTANYDRRGVEVQRKASKTLHVPYKGRKANQ